MDGRDKPGHDEEKHLPPGTILTTRNRRRR
jgi:hypothetical protein